METVIIIGGIDFPENAGCVCIRREASRTPRPHRSNGGVVGGKVRKYFSNVTMARATTGAATGSCVSNMETVAALF